ncbi:basic helix-loop-helix and HMG box domain-containing protein 1 [Octodon degus]|uniref:Basic helix-loop-helix and HMG box domain-containing protein 1 n=1 Tax=Octodon degus TaxID=10160 RepID=A0A6P6DJP6_OCTDE|nr:basic helix-loop-helix and HMG box domain-containing protein 1 [Octodon degus]
MDIESQILSQNRNQKKNHTTQLQELALLIPVTLKTGAKKLTKKEILLHVLHYIQYLQRAINVVKALLKFYLSNEEGGLEGLGWNPAPGPARQRHSTPPSSQCSQNSHLWGAYQKPRKKKLTRTASELQTGSQKSRRFLALDTPKKLVTFSDQKEENMGRTTTPPRCPDACDPPKTALASSQEGDGDGEAGAQLILLNLADDINLDDITSYCFPNELQEDEPGPAVENASRDRMICFLDETPFYPRQQMISYESSEEDKEIRGADPWLPVCTPESSQESLLALSPAQVPTWNATDHPSKILGLSPSFFSSLNEELPQHILEDDSMFLTQGLLEDVLLDPMSPPSACMLVDPQQDALAKAPEVSPDFYSRCQASVSLDHCYLSKSETNRALSGPNCDTDTDSPLENEEVRGMDSQAESLQSSSEEEDEDDTDTWSPTQRPTLSTAGRKGSKVPASKVPVKPKENKKAPCAPQVKKKCVNGFIMFCRMNRKPYIRACPGTASTVATKELAQLWRVMTPKERKPYCVKARRFSRQHNRIVKQDSSDSEDEAGEIPKPFHQLLAEKLGAAQDPDEPSAPQHD